MGSSSSKFRKHLQNGDEVAALNVFNNHSDLRKGLDPNSSYGDNFQHETPLHFAARHGMKSLLRIFLFELGGNPNKTNGRKETALHCVCMEKNPQYYPVQRRRLECLTMMLQWRGAELKDGEVEKVDLGALDEKSNTGLHYAAASGLKSCVELLVNHNCPLFIENEENHTPCDCAESSSFSEIALFLESKMVFSNDTTAGGIDEIPPQVDSEEYSGLRAQDLQEAKDQLLVETADMLSIPLFTAEALLRNHEWSREMLLDAWMTDPQACCEKSGVTPPANLFSEKPVVEESLSSPTLSHPPSPFAECDICTQHLQIDEEPVHMPCHQFCRGCWEGYLNVKIKEGGVHDITCPGYDCTKLVPVEVIENVVSRDMARRYLQFDIKAFVDSNPNIKWCPYPGCGRAVRLPDLIEGSTSSLTSPRHNNIPSDTSRAVDCGHGHHFCWECMGEAHAPCSCDNLKKWFGEINKVKPDKLDGTETDCENAANCLWLVTNSKSCPNCKSPIQKNEGCNHMKCSKCKYDFCWVCLDQWKRHNSSTGGYFKCNRYEVSKKVDESSKSQILEAEEKNTKLQELNKFVHYYTRYKNHENSFKFEEPLIKTAKEKMLKLAEAVTDMMTAKDETKFVEEAVHKLLRARRVLKFSYVYGYYLDGPPYRKIVFEFMQTELEECTEILSQMVNRLYLRTPRKKIIDQSQLVHRKRVEFITAISKGLVPPETPPNMRKKRRKYSMETEDEDLRKAILASIKDFDPENPWIVDASGRHTNVAAFLDWPSEDSEEEEESEPVPSTTTTSDVASTSQESPPGQCLRDSCSRRRAKNPRTGEYHNFCSLRCSRIYKQRKEETPQVYGEYQLDEQMDFLRALEMSRLQFMKEQGANIEGDRSDSRSSDDVNTNRSHDPDIYTPAERLDIEIKRLLELSSLGTDSFDDQKAGISDSTLEEKPAQNVSRFGENQSTVVSRVPNKSVEDLYHADCAGCQLAQSISPATPCKQPHPAASFQRAASFEDNMLESLGACGGSEAPLKGPEGVQYSSTESEEPDLGQMVDSIRIEGKMLQRMLNTDTIDKPFQENSIGASSSGFGVIKDISVANIHAGDEDKTSDFLAKDFSTGISQPPLIRTRVVDRGNGRLFAANTPGEDEKVFCLVSPESDFSESSSSEVWGYRPERVAIHTKEQTPETDSSMDGCSYADLPNQNAHNKHVDSIEEASPLFGEEMKASNLIGETEANPSTDNPISIVEMTENLLQMTLEMQDRINQDLNTHPVSNPETGDGDLLDDQVIDLQNTDRFPEPPSGWIDDNVMNNEDGSPLDPPTPSMENVNEAISQPGELSETADLNDSVSVETEFSVDSVTNEETVTTSDNRNQNGDQTHFESRSTFV